ncbi:hypothetical protein Tsp_11320 [Trichinella spiralis]|uniref:hypothetical protein n=1 Tax=Trichinella spiralis TaxID=6334 RepID=UPI0001EFEF25|nr:hypothetical protein Tsp_11320 [Trichinella spiralis]
MNSRGRLYGSIHFVYAFISTIGKGKFKHIICQLKIKISLAIYGTTPEEMCFIWTTKISKDTVDTNCSPTVRLGWTVSRRSGEVKNFPPCPPVDDRGAECTTGELLTSNKWTEMPAEIAPIFKGPFSELCSNWVQMKQGYHTGEKFAFNIYDVSHVEAKHVIRSSVTGRCVY